MKLSKWEQNWFQKSQKSEVKCFIAHKKSEYEWFIVSKLCHVKSAPQPSSAFYPHRYQVLTCWVSRKCSTHPSLAKLNPLTCSSASPPLLRKLRVDHNRVFLFFSPLKCSSCVSMPVTMLHCLLSLDTYLLFST